MRCAAESLETDRQTERASQPQEARLASCRTMKAFHKLPHSAIQPYTPPLMMFGTCLFGRATGGNCDEVGARASEGRADDARGAVHQPTKLALFQFALAPGILG